MAQDKKSVVSEKTGNLALKRIEDIKRTLLARIIPSMPPDVEGSHGKASGYGYVREFIRKEIERFEFEQYFKLTEKLTTDRKEHMICPVWQCGGILHYEEGRGKGEDDWQMGELQCSNFKEHRFIVEGKVRADERIECENEFEKELVNQQQTYRKGSENALKELIREKTKELDKRIADLEKQLQDFRNICVENDIRISNLTVDKEDLERQLKEKGDKNG